MLVIDWKPCFRLRCKRQSVRIVLYDLAISQFISVVYNSFVTRERSRINIHRITAGCPKLKTQKCNKELEEIYTMSCVIINSFLQTLLINVAISHAMHNFSTEYISAGCSTVHLYTFNQQAEQFISNYRLKTVL